MSYAIHKKGLTHDIEEAYEIQDNLEPDYYDYEDEGHFMGKDIPGLLSIMLKKLAMKLL